MPYRFEDFNGHLPAFLERCESRETRDAVVSWLLDMVADPEAVDATPVPGLGLAMSASTGSHLM